MSYADIHLLEQAHVERLLETIPCARDVNGIPGCFSGNQFNGGKPSG